MRVKVKDLPWMRFWCACGVSGMIRFVEVAPLCPGCGRPIKKGGIMNEVTTECMCDIGLGLIQGPLQPGKGLFSAYNCACGRWHFDYRYQPHAVEVWRLEMESNA
jgi:hypothetical protein